MTVPRAGGWVHAPQNVNDGVLTNRTPCSTHSPLDQDDDYGVQGMVQTSAQARAAGMTVLATESFSSATSDATTAVNRSLTLGCRVFVVW